MNTLLEEKNSPRLALVVPCYNEAAVLSDTLAQLTALLESMIRDGEVADNSYVMCIDDGSKDETWSIVRDWNKRLGSRVRGIKLARNVGHQKALLAGLHAVKKDATCAVSIDADLQDDLGAIKQMVQKFKAGAEIVYGVRSQRRSDTPFKRVTALAFYRFMRRMGVEIVENHADFRLMGSRALDGLTSYQEANLFLRGMVPLLGFRSEVVYYERRPRTAGESKYPLRKMLSFAWEGITSFSAAPLRMISVLGVVLFLVSFLAALYSLFGYLFGRTVPGWASVAVGLYMLSGIQLLAIGVIGEYLAKVYLETKRRPQYQIETELL